MPQGLPPSAKEFNDYTDAKTYLDSIDAVSKWNASPDLTAKIDAAEKIIQQFNQKWPNFVGGRKRKRTKRKRTKRRKSRK